MTIIENGIFGWDIFNITPNVGTFIIILPLSNHGDNSKGEGNNNEKDVDFVFYNGDWLDRIN